MAATDQLVLPASVSHATRGREAWTRLGLGNRLALIAFAAVLLASFLGPFLAPHSVRVPVGAPFTSPGHGALLGTDDVGRDMFSRILYGARETWIGTLIVVGVGAGFGTLVGLVAGAVGGRVHFPPTRITAPVPSLPSPVLAI